MKKKVSSAKEENVADEHISRKMGFLEKAATHFHDARMGAGAVSSVIKVKGHVGFDNFKKAWKILFLRHPFLRAKSRIEGEDYFFDFSARFSDIPINLIKDDSLESWQFEYGNRILRPFELDQYFWRASLVQSDKGNYCYIIFATPHSICDGMSISSLLGELLEVISAINKNIAVTTDSGFLPLPLIFYLACQTQFCETHSYY